MPEHIDNATLGRCRQLLWMQHRALSKRDHPSAPQRSARNALRYLVGDTVNATEALRLILGTVKSVAYDDKQVRKLINQAYQRGLEASPTKGTDNE